MIIHQAEHFPDINVHRALLDTPAATHTSHSSVVLVQKVFEFVHETLPDPLQFLAARVVARAVQGEQRKHAGIQVPQSHPVVFVDLVLDVEAPASGAEKGADTAVDTRKLDFVPKIGVK